MRKTGKLIRMGLILVLGGTTLYGARAYRDDLVLAHTLAAVRLIEPDCRIIELATLEDGWTLAACADQPPSIVRLSLLTEEMPVEEEVGSYPITPPHFQGPLPIQ